MLDRLGVADIVRPKGRMIPATPVGEIVARGEAQIGFQQLSELKPVKGIRIIGLVPDELQKVTAFSGGCGQFVPPTGLPCPARFPVLFQGRSRHPRQRHGAGIAEGNAMNMSSTLAANGLAGAASRKSAFKSIFIVASGNFLEMFDFMVFGYYATYISKAFFPTGSEFASLLLTLMTFGAGFLMRPVGALVLGAYVDRHGRRKGCC
jgi:hypothetical protein